jgi:3-hydroxyacyl-CoA dehydrogenase
MGLLQPTLEESGLDSCDFVIEAVVESLAVKQKLFAELSRTMAPTAILATNTSSLSIDEIGQLASRRERIVGMHFFNPVEKMPLVEVIAGSLTGETAVRTATAFARRLGKTPVIVRDGPGFLVNRLLAFYSAEAMWLLDEGHRVEAIDRALVDWGMPMGPLRLADEVGLDVSAKVGQILHAAFPDRLSFPAWIDRIAEDEPPRHEVRQGDLSLPRNGRELEADPAIYAHPRARAQSEPGSLRRSRTPAPADGERGGALSRGGRRRGTGLARPGARLRHRLSALPRRPLPLGRQRRVSRRSSGGWRRSPPSAWPAPRAERRSAKTRRARWLLLGPSLLVIVRVRRSRRAAPAALPFSVKERVSCPERPSRSFRTGTPFTGAFSVAAVLAFAHSPAVGRKRPRWSRPAAGRLHCWSPRSAPRSWSAKCCWT